MSTVPELITAWREHPDRVVLFDFNGTLSDDEPLLLRIYTEMFLEHVGWTLTARHYYACLAGRSDREIIGMIVEELDDSETLADALLAERRARYRELVARSCPISAGAAELVRGLHTSGIRLGIVTGAEREDVDYVLAAAGLSRCFDVIVTAEDVTTGKPDPEGFQRAARELGVAPASVLVFEDSLHGVRASRAAGMSCLGVLGPHAVAELAAEADGVIERLDTSIGLLNEYPPYVHNLVLFYPSATK